MSTSIVTNSGACAARHQNQRPHERSTQQTATRGSCGSLANTAARTGEPAPVNVLVMSLVLAVVIGAAAALGGFPGAHLGLGTMAVAYLPAIARVTAAHRGQVIAVAVNNRLLTTIWLTGPLEEETINIHAAEPKAGVELARDLRDLMRVPARP